MVEIYLPAAEILQFGSDDHNNGRWRLPCCYAPGAYQLKKKFPILWIPNRPCGFKWDVVDELLTTSDDDGRRSFARNLRDRSTWKLYEIRCMSLVVFSHAVFILTVNEKQSYWQGTKYFSFSLLFHRETCHKIQTIHSRLSRSKDMRYFKRWASQSLSITWAFDLKLNHTKFSPREDLITLHIHTIWSESMLFDVRFKSNDISCGKRMCSVHIVRIRTTLCISWTLTTNTFRS